MGFFSNLFKPTTSSVRSPFETNPWEAQQGYLTQGFSAASNALDNGLGINNGITDYTADLTADQTGYLNSIQSFGSNLANGAGQQALQAGQQGLGSMGAYQQNTQDLYNRAGQNQTGQILQDAGQYANNPYLQGQIDSAIGDVRKGFDQQVGGINSGASGTGNINSTRAGTLEAYARDDAMDRAGQISSSMRGDAYQQGLGMAQGQNQMQFSNMMGANQNNYQATALGGDLSNLGGQLGLQGLNAGLGAAGGFQTQNQNEINGERERALAQQSIVGQYMQNVGGNYGNSGYTTSVSQSQSPFQTLVGAGVTLAGMRE